MLIKITRSLVLALVLFSFTLDAQIYRIYYEDSPQISFGISELEKALEEYDVKMYRLKGTPIEDKSNLIVIGTMDNNQIVNYADQINVSLNKNIKNEGFQILITGERSNSFLIVGYDDAGAMYGTLEAAERILTKGIKGITDLVQNPYMQMRGTKFNIPLDVRTPSYSDVSDAAQKNIPEMWNFDFWKEYIDNLARYRYNFISLWNLHPFPSMVKVPDYPDIALEDVRRSTVEWDEHYPLQGIGFCTPEILNNYEIIKRMSIDEKIDFWRKVMKYGNERNVDFYVVTWNIFVYGTDGKYGITDDFRNKTTIDYFRKSVAEMFRTYPDLKGIGLTTGENFEGADFTDKEDWAFNTYGKGVLDASEDEPDRKITFIHRQHQTGALDIADKFKPLIDNSTIDFIFSFKYAKAHVYSSTVQTYHPGFVEEIQSGGDLKTIWTLRNDDVYYFQWGAPDFVREFIKNIPYEVSQGYYYGSDQYIWGREFLSKFHSDPRKIEIEKHWYQWMLWGRLGYNPDLENGLFTDLLGLKYNKVPKEELFKAFQSASMIYPVTTGFHWGSLDFQWYIESGQSLPGPADTPTGFHDVNRFISLPPHPGSGYISIPDYVEATLSNKQIEGKSPREVCKTLHEHTDRSLKILDQYESVIDRDTKLFLQDIRIISYLGKYYAHKIAAATELHLFRKTAEPEHRINVKKELIQAAKYWRLYSSTALPLHKNPLWTNRVGYVDWKENYEHVLYDLTITGSEKVVDVPFISEGVVLEAEEASKFSGKLRSNINGYSGKGCIENSDEIVWEFNADEEMYYSIDYRYGMSWGKNHPGILKINDIENYDLSFWTTGSPKNLAWDRVIVKLNAGINKISIKLQRPVFIDNINIQPFFN